MLSKSNIERDDKSVLIKSNIYSSNRSRQENALSPILTSTSSRFSKQRITFRTSVTMERRLSSDSQARSNGVCPSKVLTLQSSEFSKE